MADLAASTNPSSPSGRRPKTDRGQARPVRNRLGRCPPVAAQEGEQDWPCALTAADPSNHRRPLPAVERKELHFVIVLARVQRVEIRISINAQNLAVNDEMLLPVSAGRFHDPRQTLAPVVTALGDQPDPVTNSVN